MSILDAIKAGPNLRKSEPKSPSPTRNSMESRDSTSGLGLFCKYYLYSSILLLIVLCLG